MLFVLNTKMLKMIQQNSSNVYVTIKINKKISDDNAKKRFINTYKFANQGIISLFCCYEKLFIYMNRQMIGRESMRHHKRIVLYSLKHVRYN